MNKFLIFFIILLTSPFVFSTHCWEVGDLTTSSPKIDWTPSGVHIILDGSSQFEYGGVTISSIVVPGAKATFKDFGNYNLVCNNGATNKILPFTKLEILDANNEIISRKYNSVDYTKCADEWSPLPYCKRVNGVVHDDPNNQPIGKGTHNSIDYFFNEKDNDTGEGFDFGIYTIKGSIDKKSVTGRTDSEGNCGNQMEEKVSQSFLFATPPSLYIFTPPEKTIKFYDTEGNYSEEVFFTITKNNPLKIEIEDLTINCNNNYGVTCEMIDSLEGFIMDDWNDTIVVTVRINVNKSEIKKQGINDTMTVTLRLDANYSLEQVPSGIEYKTSSQPKIYTIGLIDQQDFQIKIQGGEETPVECISHDGLIGVTGPDYSPRINLSFAGGDDGEIRADTCDLKKIDGSNNDWVYCTQNEFLFSLANKIGNIIQIKNNIIDELNQTNIDNEAINTLNDELEKYSFSEINIRDIDLSKEKISEHLNNFNTEFAERDGLEGFSSSPVNYGGTDSTERISKLKELFAESGVVNFKLYGGLMSDETLLKAGRYDLEISIISNSSNDLFDTDGSVNDEYTIEVNLSNWTKPSIDWFFYRNNFGEIDEGMIYNTGGDFSNTNNTERGIVLTFNKQNVQTNPEKIHLTKMFATPLFVKIEKKNDLVTNNFDVKKIVTGLEKDDAFSYWTGFASNKGNGCEEISPTQLETTKSLFYRIADLIVDVQTDGTLNVKIQEYDDINSSNIELLQTIIYAPLEADAQTEEIELTGPISMYANSNNKCNYNDNNCSMSLTRNTSNYYVDDIKEIFDRIAEKEICIAEEFDGTEKEWILFWNDKKLLDSLDGIKQVVVEETAGLEICIK